MSTRLETRFIPRNERKVRQSHAESPQAPRPKWGAGNHNVPPRRSPASKQGPTPHPSQSYDPGYFYQYVSPYTGGGGVPSRSPSHLQQSFGDGHSPTRLGGGAVVGSRSRRAFNLPDQLGSGPGSPGTDPQGDGPLDDIINHCEELLEDLEKVLEPGAAPPAKPAHPTGPPSG